MNLPFWECYSKISYNKQVSSYFKRDNMVKEVVVTKTKSEETHKY